MQSILDAITEWIKGILIGAINGNLSTMFGDVNEKVGTIANEVEIYAYCSVSPIPFATMTNREWGQIGNNYLKGLFALGFQGFLIMVCVGIYAVLVNDMIIADNLHSAIFSLAAYTVILCFSLFKSGALAKQIFSAH